MAAPRTAERFKHLMERSKRDWAASKVVVGILRADSKAAQAIERALAHALTQATIVQPPPVRTFQVRNRIVTAPPRPTRRPDCRGRRSGRK